MKPIDVHAHLCDEAFENDRENVILRIDEQLHACICSSYDKKSSFDAVALAKKSKNIFASVGVHPENAETFFEFLPELGLLAKESCVVAIGEIGLDYHFFSGMSEEEIESDKHKQQDVFAEQIELANKLNLPIQVHCRDAMEDCLEVLQKHKPKMPSLMHCFSGSIGDAKKLMELNFSFSFGGITTFKNAKSVQEAVQGLPLERIMLETDCPYLSPEPNRGKRNEPINVKYVADKIAVLRGLRYEEVVDITTQNAIKMFNIKTKN